MSIFDEQLETRGPMGLERPSLPCSEEAAAGEVRRDALPTVGKPARLAPGTLQQTNPIAEPKEAPGQ